MTEQDYPMAGEPGDSLRQQVWTDSSGDSLAITGDVTWQRVDFTACSESEGASVRVTQTQLLEIRDHINLLLREVFGHREDGIEEANRLRTAITNCLEHFNGRQTEMGDRAMNALEYLEEAIRGGGK